MIRKQKPAQSSAICSTKIVISHSTRKPRLESGRDHLKNGESPTDSGIRPLQQNQKIMKISPKSKNSRPQTPSQLTTYYLLLTTYNFQLSTYSPRVKTAFVNTPYTKTLIALCKNQTLFKISVSRKDETKKAQKQ